MKYQYIVSDSGEILHKHEGEPIKFGGPWQYATRIESTIKDGKVSTANGEVKIIKK